ncbi:MAG: hypothetical protein ACRDKI_00745 [Solirubrobacterales bacterium]
MRWLAVALGIAALAFAGCGDDAPKDNSNLVNPTAVTGGAKPGATGGGKAGGKSAACSPGKEQPKLDFSEIRGRTLPDAQALATKHGYTIRPVVVNGEPQAVTMDFNEKRINVELKAGTIAAYCGVG